MRRGLQASKHTAEQFAERAPLLLCAFAVAVFVAIGIVLLHVKPPSVFFVFAFALLASRRPIPSLPRITWPLVVALLALPTVEQYPTIANASVSISTVSIVIAVFLATLAPRCRNADIRRALPLLASLIVVFGLVFAPLSAGIQTVHSTLDVQLSDLRQGGALHGQALNNIYGPDYIALMHLIQEKTPENATIAFPDQFSYPIAGNPELSNYFVYPRNIKSENLSHTPIFDITGATHTIAIAQGGQLVWPLFFVPVRMYYHAPAQHRVTFGSIAVTGANGNVSVAPSALQPWQTAADRTVTGDVTDEGARTVTTLVSASATDPWMASVRLPLSPDTAISTSINTNAGETPALSEQVSLLVEVQGPAGETALFASTVAAPVAGQQLLQLRDLSHRAEEYARVRGWQPGPLLVTRVGLDMGWQVPLPRIRTDAVVVVEDGGGALPDGPDSFALLTHDARRQIQSGSPDAAVNLAAAALLLRPNDLEGQFSLGDAFRIAGRWQEGARFLTTLLNDQPTNSWAQYNLALMQRGMGDRAAARTTLAPLLSATPVLKISESESQGQAPPIAPAAIKVSTPVGPGGGTTRSTLTATGTIAGAGADSRPNVTVQYHTGDGSAGQLWISSPGGPQALASAGSNGTVDASWIAKGSAITFQLYAGTSHETLLNTITVAYQPEISPPQLVVSEKTVGADADAKTIATVRWDTGDGSWGQVWYGAQNNDGSLLAAGPAGEKEVPLVGATMTVRLYAGAAHTTILGTVHIEDVNFLVSPQWEPWVLMLDAQLAAELGDITAARATYEKVIKIGPPLYGVMAQSALAQLEKG